MVVELWIVALKHQKVYLVQLVLQMLFLNLMEVLNLISELIDLLFVQGDLIYKRIVLRADDILLLPRFLL